MGLQHLLPKLKHQSNEKDVLDQPLFIDIVIRDEEKGTLLGSPHKYDFESNSREPSIHRDATYELEKYPEDLSEKDIELHAAPATRLHMLDFLKAIEENHSPTASVIEGHISSASCILANISLQTGRPISYNHLLKEVPNDKEATELLERPYRAPWKHPLPENFI